MNTPQSSSPVWLRTHRCGTLTAADAGRTVTLNGWLAKSRNLGGLLFLDLRDQSGKLQVVVNPETHGALFHQMESVRQESTLGVRGTVRLRPGEMQNAQMATGAVEIVAEEIQVYSESEVLPFAISDITEASDALRLQYRYLDLRRDSVKEKILQRIRIAQLFRKSLESHGFLDFETPYLYKSTPEGAREFLVPSRMHPGSGYALPQSPQLFKQLLMVSGFDRYYQIVKCFRDEDMRADRQPEFTQIDCEISFATLPMVLETFDAVMKEVVNAFYGCEKITSIPRITYQYAMDTYGSDKPDTRFDLKLQDLSALVHEVEFAVFQTALSQGGIVNAIVVPQQEAFFSRKRLDEYTELMKQNGLAGLGWIKVQAEGWQSPMAKFFSPAQIEAVQTALGAKPGDVVLVAAGPRKTVQLGLGLLRNTLAKHLNLTRHEDVRFLWVTDFPAFEYNEEGKRWAACHHPFTSPAFSDIDRLETDPGSVHAAAYDLVCNGFELGGGSIRIHQPELQARVFALLGLSPAETEQKFGFLLKALRLGAPPHGGIALGLDRIAMILTGSDAIRDVIPFPKTQRGTCLLTGSPSPLSPQGLSELHLQWKELP